MGHGQQANSYLIKAGKLFDSESGQFKTGYVILVKEKLLNKIPGK